MTVNMGPQHPSTHGVLRLVLELDGETVVSAAPTIGYLHTGIEKTAEQKKFQQVIPLVERMDYLSAQSNAYGYCLSVEKLLGLEMPDRVKWIRVLLAELQRINSHLVWLGTHAMEVGAVSVMLYCFRERELLLDINERIAGFRMFPSYIRVGGLREDLPRGFHDAVTQFLESFPVKLGEYEDLLTKNDIYRKRTQGVGTLSMQDCMNLSLTGPIGRASGWNYDVRKMFPYGGYETFEFDVPLGEKGDVYERYRVRIAEMRESVKICRQALSRISPAGVFAADAPTVVPPPKDRVYTEMEALIQHFLIYSQGFTVPAGDAYVPVEGPRGEQGFYVVSDGTNRPWRLKARSPSLLACQALPQMIIGGLIADVIAVIGSIDVVMGDVDRMTGAERWCWVQWVQCGNDFSSTIDYRELHRSKRQMPVDDGKPFVYTPENRERLEAIARRYPENPVGRRSAILPALYLVQRQIGYISLNAIPHVAEADWLYGRRCRGRGLVLHDVLYAAGGDLCRAGMPDVAVRAARRRTGDRRADDRHRHRTERH